MINKYAKAGSTIKPPATEDEGGRQWHCMVDGESMGPFDSEEECEDAFVSAQQDPVDPT